MRRLPAIGATLAVATAAAPGAGRASPSLVALIGDSKMAYATATAGLVVGAILLLIFVFAATRRPGRSRRTGAGLVATLAAGALIFGAHQEISSYRPFDLHQPGLMLTCRAAGKPDSPTLSIAYDGPRHCVNGRTFYEYHDGVLSRVILPAKASGGGRRGAFLLNLRPDPYRRLPVVLFTRTRIELSSTDDERMTAVVEGIKLACPADPGELSKAQEVAAARRRALEAMTGTRETNLWVCR